jgi:DnaJ-class molecular chaperone
MAATTPTYYDVLRVDRRAPPDAIRRAYRRLAQQYHPDKMPGNANASRAMAAINAAYEVLSDAHQRAEHDRWIHSVESRPMPLSDAAAHRIPEAAWPWYLLFATMAFAMATVGTAVYLTTFPLH